jgi:VanZ family protein
MSSKPNARIGLILFSLLILAGSSIPSDQIPKAFQLTPDKLIHCAEYFILGVLLYRWLLIEFSSLNSYSIFLLTLLAGSGFGVLDENYQRLTPGRTPDTGDWAIDTLGVLFAGIAGYYVWSRKQKKPR